HLERRPHRGAATDAAQHLLLAGQPARRLERRFLFHPDHLVHHFGIRQGPPDCRRTSTSSPAASNGPSNSCKQGRRWPWGRSPCPPASVTRASSPVTSSASSASRRGSSARPQESQKDRKSRQEGRRSPPSQRPAW